MPGPPSRPWLACFGARLDALAPLDGAARLRTLNDWAGSARIVVGSGRRLRFVPADPLPVAASPAPAGYEARIDASGEVATRTDGPGARHDLYNALAWLAWPRTKARLNALHVAAIRAGTGAVRGPLRDAATLFDENGAAWVSTDAELAAMLRAFDWRRLFVEARVRVATGASVAPIGHALLEKLDTPYPAITAHAWPLALPADAPHAAIDAALAEALQADTLSTRALCPLPVLGLPGWWAANADPAFYNDATVFRAGRRRVLAAEPVRDQET